MIFTWIAPGTVPGASFCQGKSLDKKKKNGTILATMRDGVAVTLHSSEV